MGGGWKDGKMEGKQPAFLPPLHPSARPSCIRTRPPAPRWAACRTGCAGRRCSRGRSRTGRRRCRGRKGWAAVRAARVPEQPSAERHVEIEEAEEDDLRHHAPRARGRPRCATCGAGRAARARRVSRAARSGCPPGRPRPSPRSATASRTLRPSPGSPPRTQSWNVLSPESTQTSRPAAAAPTSIRAGGSIRQASRAWSVGADLCNSGSVRPRRSRSFSQVRTTNGAAGWTSGAA